ncbi:MAG: hypothetical protein RBR46_02995 [Acholeplasmatales bacterium]|jgi:hypothetical protein|nr:hypothetical protein [Acholeplasmatales bacterium]
MEDLKKVALEIIEKLEIIRSHRAEEQGILSQLMDDELLETINTLTRLLAENYIKE